MKICYIFSTIDLGEITGQPAMALRIIEQAMERGCEVGIISNSQKPNPKKIFAGGTQCLLDGSSSFKSYALNSAKIIKFLQEFQPDILHVKGLLLIPYIWLLNHLFLHIPMVFSVYDTPERFPWILRKLVVFSLKHNITFTSSQYIKNVLIQNGTPGDRILIKHTGLKKEFYNYQNINNIADSDISYFGDSFKERGFDIIFQLAKKMPELKFKVLIRWTKKDCQIELEEMKKLPNVTVWHHPYAEDLKTILSKSKLIILPFRWMGMRPPISLLEAMLLGKCVITSPLGGNEEIIENGNNGIIIDFNNLESVIAKIDSLLKDNDLRATIGKKAKETITKKFTVSEYDKIFQYYLYNAENIHYEKRMFGNIGGSLVSAKEIELLLNLLQPEKNEQILDVGTGSGRFARAIIKHSDASVTGLDPDEKILVEGKNLGTIYLSPEEKIKYTTILGNGHNLPFENNQFDKVFCFRALKYYQNPWRGIDELIRVLKPGGTLVLEIISEHSWESLVRPWQKSSDRQYVYFWEKNISPFNPREVTKYLLDRNMTILEEKALHKIPPLIYTKLNSNLANCLLNLLDKLLLMTTPKYLFSKSIILKCKKYE